MDKKKVTLTIEAKTYNDFKKYCKARAIVLSKRIEIFMKEILNGKNLLSLFFSIFFIISLVQSVNASVIFSDGFESGSLVSWNLTSASGANDWTVTNIDPFEQIFHAQSQPQSTSEPASIMEINISTSGYQNINFSYYRKLIGLDSADEFQSMWFNGTGWTVLDFTGSSAANDASYNFTIFSLPSTASNNPNFKIRFECTAGAVSEYCRIDNVTINGEVISEPDTFPPRVKLIFPFNGTTTTNNTNYFLANLTDNIQLKNTTLHMWNSSGNLVLSNFSLVSGLTNLSNLSLVLPYSGTFYWNYIAFDNSSNYAYNDTNFTLIYQIIDNEHPSFSNFLENPLNGTNYSQGAFYRFNATIISTNGTAGIEFNGTNYTIHNSTSNIFNFSISNLAVGTYRYYWWAYGNGTSNNFNNSSPRYYTINKNNSNTILFLNNISNNLTIQYPQQINATASTNAGNLTIYRNGIDVTNQNGLNITLGVGYYNYTAITSGNQNYSSSSVTYFVNITKANPTLSYLLNNISNNLTIQYPQQINATASTNAGNLTIYRNGIDVTNQNGLNITLGVGYYNYTFDIIGNQNYSNLSRNLFLNLTRASQSFLGLLNGVNSNISLVYPQQVNASYSGVNQTEVSISINGVSVSIAQNYSFGVMNYIVNYSATGNQNYSSFSTILEFTINKSISQINLTLNNSATNITLNSGNSIWLNSSLIQGDVSGRILLYLNNSLINNNTLEVNNLTNFTNTGLFNITSFYEETQNYSSSSITYFVNVTEEADNEHPSFSNFLENPLNGTNYSQGAVYRFNATIISTNGTAGIEFNGINYTIRNSTSNIFNFSISNLAVGTYRYYWWAYGNGTSNNFNNSSPRYYTINKQIPNLNYYLNGLTNNLTIQYPQQVNATASTNAGNLTIYRNGIDVTNQNGLNITLGVGYYNYTFDIIGNQNYSNLSRNLFLNLTSNSSNSPPIINSILLIVNNTNSTPLFGENFFIKANVSDADNDSIQVSFTLINPNGTRVIDNLLGSEYSFGGYSIWNSTNYTIDEYGYWNWSVIASDGINQTNQNGSFRVLADLSFFPSEYIITPDPKNQTLIWNLTMYHNSLEDYNFTFNYSLNSTFFNLTFSSNSSVLNKSVYNDTNLFKNQIIIKTSLNTIEGVVYLGNITITRNLDGKKYIVPLTIGIDPPSGDVDAIDIPSLNLCSRGICNVVHSMKNDEVKEFIWGVKNTGNFTLSNCIPSIDGFDTTGFGSFNLNNFNLEINETKNLTLTIDSPPINTYYGKIEIVCKATSMSFEDALGAESENAPSLKIVVSASSSSGGSSGGTSTGSGGGGSFVAKDIFEITGGDLDKLKIGRGKSESIEWIIKNTGNKFLNGCLISANGGVSSWFSMSQIESLSPGQEVAYFFNVNTPINADNGDYFTELSVKCKETSIIKRYDLSIISGDFEMIILNSERIGTKLRVEYSLENFADKNKIISFDYKMISSKQTTILEDEVKDINLSPKEKVVKNFEFELPKNSVGDYTLLIEATDGTESSKYEQKIKLSSAGISGLAISDNNLRTVSWTGIVILLSIGIFLVIKSIRNQIAIRRANQVADRQYIPIDLNN